MHGPAVDKVLIVGAGPAGLALAQILQNNDIPFEVFERDAEYKIRKQGWCIALHSCLDRLKSLLPEHLRNVEVASVNSAVGCLDEWAVMNGTTGEQIASKGGVPRGQPGYFLRVRREGLRDHLWQGLPVKTGKQFTHYTEDDGGVTAFFKDGTSCQGAILVGVDGAHSRVREQLLGQKSSIAPYTPIMGECELPPRIFEPLRKIGNAAVITLSPKLRYMAGLRSLSPDLSSASYYWAVCYRGDDPIAESAWAQSASKQELYDKALRLTQNVPSHLTEILRYTGVEGIAQPPLKFVEFVPPDALPPSRVTLMGDAAHAMMPFGLAGANTAVADACDLAEMLVNSQNSFSPLDCAVPLLQEYARKIIPRGKASIAASRAAAEDSHPIVGAHKDLRKDTHEQSKDTNKDVKQYSGTTRMLLMLFDMFTDIVLYSISTALSLWRWKPKSQS